MQKKHLNITGGWLNNIKARDKILSPNFDERSSNTPPSLIVIHGISLPPKKFRGEEVIDFFQNKLDHTAHPYFKKLVNIKVSSHFFIRRRGRLVQFVSCEQKAWHAGVSKWQGQDNCNDFSIGIELEGHDDMPYTNSQYKKLILLISALKHAYPIVDIVGHSDIAPGRKTDPGKFFQWHKIK